MTVSPQVLDPAFHAPAARLDALYGDAVAALKFAAVHPSMQNMAKAVDAWREWETAAFGKAIT